MSSHSLAEDGSSENEEKKAMLQNFNFSPKKKVKSKKPLFFRSSSSASFFRGLRRLGSSSSTCSSDEDTTDVNKSLRSNPGQSLVGRSLSAGSDNRCRRKRLMKQSTFCDGDIVKEGVICSTKELTSILSLKGERCDKLRRKESSISVEDEHIDDKQCMSGSSKVVPTLHEEFNEEDEDASSIVKWDDNKGIDAQDIGGAIEQFLQSLSIDQTVP